ncbi:MAG TPA: hypothetical protein VKE69_02030, partial [Planctomycetota bacterium]|nr:hypothetical protein [Planctomycetota bacterium]
VRNPELLGALLVAIGIVLLAASEGKRGRWVPRAIAPIGLLVFFADALPVADAALRERTRASGAADAQRWLAETPALVPRWTAFRASEPDAAPAPRRRRFAREATLGAFVLVVVALCIGRERFTSAIGF